jgi:putative redox protein
VERRFASDGIELVGHLARPSGSSPPRATVVLCHGYPDASVGSAGAGGDLGELADRIASTMGWLAFTFSFRGCGASGGNFSLSGWMHDIVAAADELRDTEGVDELWLVGFGTGGGLSLGAAVEMGKRVLGVATLAAPAGFDDWGTHTRRLLQHSRDVGVIRDASFPQAADAWAKEFRAIRPVDDAARLADLPMLVVHGSEDESVPVFDARVLADAHGSAELRIIAGAGHGLRYDPRAVAVLLGWLDREQSQAMT